MQHQDEAPHKLKDFLRNLRLFILVLVIVTLSLVLFFNIDEINTDNFRRLLAKLDFSFNQTGVKSAENISFNSDSLNCYEIYKGGLAVLSTDGLRVYDEKGNEFTGLQTIYRSPAMLTTRKYILTYDRGGTLFNISNSFANVFTKSFENKIINACMSENGSFAVISQSEGYKSLVSVYDSSFKEKFKLYSAEKYILSCDISPDGSSLAVATLRGEKANIEAGVSLYKIGTETPFFNFTIAESTPFEIKYKSNGSFYVLTDEKAYFFNRDGKKEGEIDFEGRLLINYANNHSKYTAFILGENITQRKTSVIIADEKGIALTKGEVEGEVKFSSFSNNSLALLQSNNILLIDLINKSSMKVKKNIVIKGEIGELLTAGNTGFAIGGNYAQIVNLE